MGRQESIDYSGVDLRRPLAEVAAELGCDPSTVWRARQRNGIPGRVHRSGWGKYDWETVDWKKTDTEIAAALGCTVPAVGYQRKRRGK